MEGLDLDNILDEDALSLFNNIEEIETPDNNEETGEENKETKETKETTEIDPEGMFGGNQSESVGSERDNEEQEDTQTDKSEGTSPKNDFFSSIAEAFAEEGILPNLDEETIKGIKTPEDFRKVIDDYLKSELDEQQRRVAEALDNNVEPDTIKYYEGMIQYLDSIDDDTVAEEGQRGEQLRQRLIFQDYINRGFPKARAEKEVLKSFKNGTDLDDAKEALLGCKEFFSEQYKKTVADAKKEREAIIEEDKKRATILKDTIFNNSKKLFGDLDLDKNTKQKIVDNIAKPQFKDPKTGNYYTAVQQYEREHTDDFLAKVGLLFTLTDGFKSLDKLVNSKVKKGIKKGLRDLESKINNTSRDSYGDLQFTSGVNDDESYLGKGIRLAL